MAEVESAEKITGQVYTTERRLNQNKLYISFCKDYV
jgi:hypothetical protein